MKKILIALSLLILLIGITKIDASTEYSIYFSQSQYYNLQPGDHQGIFDNISENEITISEVKDSNQTPYTWRITYRAVTTDKITLYLEGSHLSGQTYLELNDDGTYNFVSNTFIDNITHFRIKYTIGGDVTSPIIDGQTNYISNVDNPTLESEIRSGLSAIDNVDGHIPSTSFVLISDNYTVNQSTLGVYEIKYKVSDTAGNESFVTVKVHVVDVVKPVISGPKSYTVNYRQTQSLDQIKDNLVVTDNYDSNLTIIMISDDYTSNKTIKGTYQIKYRSTDSSNNSTDYIVTVSVIDDIKPIISGINSYVVSLGAELSEAEIRSSILAVDEYDGDLELVLVKDNYTNNKSVVGAHTITYRATDFSGNSTDFLVTINVTDDVPPIIHTNDAFINVHGALNLTIEQIINHLVRVGQLDSSVNLENYVVESTDYDPVEPGEYQILLTRTESAPEDLKENISIGVKVLSSSSPGPVIPPVEKTTNTAAIILIISLVILTVYLVYRKVKKR